MQERTFWQQAYVTLVRWVIELHGMAPDRWMTLKDIYRCMLDPDRIKRKIAEVEALVEKLSAVRIASADLTARTAALAAWSWDDIGGGVVRMAADPNLREQLTTLGVAFEVETAGAADPARRERLDAVRRWYAQDWLTIDPKLRSSIIEGLSVFLSVFDLPDVAGTFCPPKPTAELAADPAAPGADTAPVARQLPPVDELIDSGKVLCLNMPAGTNPALSRAVAVLLKQAWL